MHTHSLSIPLFLSLSLPFCFSLVGTVADAFQMSPEDFEIQYGEPKPKVDDSNIVFHCRSGKRSITAMNIAKQLGYMK